MHFVIAGRINCPQFTHAVMVAQRLKENLPDFTYLRISKKPEEWDVRNYIPEKWLLQICKENDWYHVRSPVIWREIGLKHGKKDFIGDINTFLDLCFDYYGIPQNMLSAEQFNRGEINWFTHRTESEFFENIKAEAKKRREYRSRQVCITGAASQVTEIIVMELLQIDSQKRENGLEIRLFDDPRKNSTLGDKALDGKHCPGPSGFGNCRVVSSMKEALSNVDLVIVLDYFPRKQKESLAKWLKRNRNAMCALGKALNLYAPPHCRVIIGSPSTQPICYNATVLASFATKLHVRNIVAVTQDLGREALKLLSERANAPLKDFYCPPVWGFIGLNKFIDVRRTLQAHLYKVPGKRVKSTLPQGAEEYELRTSDCLISERDSDEVLSKIAQHKAVTLSHLGKWPYLAKATAIIDLLKVWGLKQEDGNGEILCLGVYSDGTFNIPQGVYWSQPVILKNGFWVPFEDFPIPRSPYFDIYYLFMFSVAALYRTKVKPRIYIPPKRVTEPKEKKKMNFDKMVENVGMPVIRTDTECVNYLKYLTNKELGIDLDKVVDYIEEEEGGGEEEEAESGVLPAGEIVKENIYCECWRQELKELQKIVFDRSSTTEVEIDLSDNISGSEWSVINPKPEFRLESSLSTQEKETSNELSEESQLFLKVTNLSSPPSTVCSCEKLSNGSVCRCLGPPEVQKESSEGGKISTEHFYKEQNAQIFDEDLRDVIYEDTYAAEKHVTFDPEAKQEDETGFHLKFYGKRDAVRDKDADLNMQKRISRYERGGENSVEDFGENEGSMTDSVEPKSIQFGMIIDGTSNDTVGFPDGLGNTEEVQTYGEGRPSSTQTLPTVQEKSTECSEIDLLFPGEGQYSFGSSFKGLPELPGEKTERYSVTSLEEDLDEAWGEGYLEETEKPGEEGGGKEKEVDKHTKEHWRKREGIPLCCLCRCLVPEGLPCCPCGSTTVVEVFRKESIEIFIQSEDDLNYKVEYFPTALKEEKPSVLSLEEPEVELTLPRRELPPESFLPFSPKPNNKFKEAVRPFELTKEYNDSFKETKKEIHPKCFLLMEQAKEKLEEMESDQGEEMEGEYGANKEDLPPICEDVEQIKTDFSDLKLFLPCGLEDWRLTVQKKYREWFFQGPKIKDEAYYDVAIEDVSEDEFEVDKELEKFFEN